MIISIVNRSKSIADATVQGVIRAINRQIAEDFEPYWSFGAMLRLEGSIGKEPDKDKLLELRGDAVIYIWDKTNMEDALGYHEANASGIPYGFVFTELSKQLGENWTVTLSHEALEMVGDSQGNLLIQGVHPTDPTVEVFHWFEMCDAVQSQTYEIDGITLSNFVLPLYFTLEEQLGGRNDFLGNKGKRGKVLASFGVAPGGYIGFYDPRKRAHDTYSAPEDKVAAKRIAIKAKNAFGRGYLRLRSEASTDHEDAHMRVIQGATKVKASATAAADPIKHVIVLMLENRSFDHMLGGITRFNPSAEGVEQKGTPNSNRTSDGKTVLQGPGAASTLANKRDVNHEHDGAMLQLGSAADPMSGFAESFRLRYPDATQAELDQVMAYFDCGDTAANDTLPVLHALARSFGVCDHWFSSMPGPTWQNRFFAHSGTCLGHLLMPTQKTPQDTHIYYQETIFDRLSDANINWKIFHDGIPQSIVLTRLLTRYLTFRGYDSMENFFQQAAGNADDFPEYAFIEPCFFGAAENDQHPPADVRRGEQLIADVYNVIRANPKLWESTLLVVTYDEHGGFYDHVPPPATVPPDGYTTEWTFDRLGVRVPAILVSPWIDPGVISTVFDHTSLLRYLCEKWNMPPLGQRMQEAAGPRRANTFGPELLKRKTPRLDTPAKLSAPALKAAMSAVEPPIEGSREALLMFIDQLPGGSPTGQAIAVKGRRVTTKRAKLSSKAAGLSVAAAEAKLDGLRERR
ncbi:MAG TPA: alkaline phosphatase family protein [Steroidobacteraceae bacterium]